MMPHLVNAQSPEKVRTIRSEFVPEQGCPVSVTESRTDLDLDPLDAPIDARIYLTYRNGSDRPIGAVKFRIRLTDNTGSDRGTFHAPDGGLVAPGQERQQKWKRDSVDPRVTWMKVRVLQVKFADGTLWESARMKDIVGPNGNGAGAPPQSNDNAGAASGR